jgi:hypothetical protein
MLYKNGFPTLDRAISVGYFLGSPEPVAQAMSPSGELKHYHPQGLPDARCLRISTDRYLIHSGRADRLWFF